MTAAQCRRGTSACVLLSHPLYELKQSNERLEVADIDTVVSQTDSDPLSKHANNIDK